MVMDFAVVISVLAPIIFVVIFMYGVIKKFIINGDTRMPFDQTLDEDPSKARSKREPSTSDNRGANSHLHHGATTQGHASKPKGEVAASISKRLHSKSELRKAVIMSEILNKKF